MLTNIYVLKSYKDAKLRSLAVWLKAHRVSANMITLGGLVFGLNGAVYLLGHQKWLGLGFLGLSAGADLLDGTVSRLGNTETFSGKIFDSVSDRLVEIAWIGALVFTGIINPWAFTLAFGSASLFLCRLWAYRRGLDSSRVLVTRFERMIAMLAVMILPWRWVALLIYLLVTIGTFISSLQIMRMIMKTKNTFLPRKARKTRNKFLNNN
jgi:phosphatidylglycerophosphate synthase